MGKWLVCAGLALAACGGGGGSGGGSGGSTPIGSNVFPAFSSTRRAEYDCSGTYRVNGGSTQAITGTQEIAGEVGSVVHPFSGLTGNVARAVQDFDIGGSPLFQIVREYGYADVHGGWSLGGELSDGTEYWWWESIDYGPPVGVVSGRYFTRFPAIDVGDMISLADMTGGAADGVTPVIDYSFDLEVVAIESVNTPLGRFDAYRIEVVAEQHIYATNVTTVTVATRWVRPDMGVIRLQSRGTATDGIDTIVMEIECEITSFSP